MDTAFYSSSSLQRPSFFSLDLSGKIVTPLNNLLYNTDPDNLALHGLHPRYTHVLINLPQLLGPAILSVIFSSRFTLPLLSAVSGATVLSFFKHQEARFLLPCVPLMLSCIQLPRIPVLKFTWIIVWVLFNASMGLLMGVLHQGGVIPVQNYIAENLENATTVIWWKTYSPPTWLLGDMNEVCKTVDLMGAKQDVVFLELELEKGRCPSGEGATSGGMVKETYLVAPLATGIETEMNGIAQRGFNLRQVWLYRNHLGFDDLDFDFKKDGAIGAVTKVWDSRGLGVWRVEDQTHESCKL